MTYPLLLFRRAGSSRKEGDTQQGLFAGFTPSSVAFARASVGMRGSEQGPWVTENADVMRYDYEAGVLRGLLYEPQKTNYVSNNTFAGAVLGSTLPAGWSVENLNGLTKSLTAIGVEDGLPYIDLRLTGTATGSLYRLNCLSTVASSSGLVWTASVCARKTGGSTSGVLSAKIGVRESGGGYSFLESDLDLSSPVLLRKAVTRNWTTSQPAALYVRLNTTSGAAIDITLRLAAPQLEAGSVITSPITTAGSVATRAADQLSFVIPSGVSTLRYGFDDGSTQDVAVSAGAYVVPTTLNRPRIKTIQGM